MEPDRIFADPRLAAIYDAHDPDRSDLDAYVRIVDEFGAASVLDIGCGTGTFACRLATAGIDVTGVDPAVASLDVARGKPGAGAVRWIAGDATTLPAMQVDMATMTANVAQVFLTDDDWLATLRGAATALCPGGHLAFEVRDPQQEAWRGWNRAKSIKTRDLGGAGVVESWVSVTDVDGDFISFRWTYRFDETDETLTSDSTLRFRPKSEIEASLAAAGFEVIDVRDAPDRPGKEFVFIARKR